MPKDPTNLSGPPAVKGWKGPAQPKGVKEAGDLDPARPKDLLRQAMAPGMNHDIPTQGTAKRYSVIGDQRMKALEAKLGKNETGQ